MLPRFFRITGRDVQLTTSQGRSITVVRTELEIEIWDGTRFDGTAGAAMWDTGADFFAVSEWYADRWGIDWRSGTEHLGTGGIGGSHTGVLIPLTIRLVRLRHTAFRVECQVLLGSNFPRPLLGNHFVRRNFNVETRGERRTYFRLRDPAPDAVTAAQLGHT